jgi:microcin C transport system substrate-binding protein
MAQRLSLVLASIACLLLPSSGALASDELPKHHALSLVGAPAHGQDYQHFKWVNPNAPKGGRVRQWAMGTFDSLNPFPVKGSAAGGVRLIYDTLMSHSPDEPSTAYGLVAEWVTYPEDFSSATFQLRSSARFHDGKPITPDDVIFSLDAIKKASPRFGFYYKNVVAAEDVGGNRVTFKFDVKGNRELPMIVGELPVLPKHFWSEKGANGEPRDLSKSTLEVPLGSGPYRIKEVDTGRTIVFERVADWWARDLPVARGQWNFDEIRIVYFRDRAPAFLAFQAGELDYWRESSAKFWATGYDFEAAKRGFVKKVKLPVATVAPMQSFAFNARRPQFQDPRVRHAFNLAFNFERSNATLFYDEYKRVGSYFEGSELKATGLPTGRELEILEEVRSGVPAEVFTTEWKNPVNASKEGARDNLRLAAKLLAEAGYSRPQGGASWLSWLGGLFGSAPKEVVLSNAAGVQLTAEFLLAQPDFERIVLPYVQDLQKLGVKASVRTVDTSQYQRRLDSFDFDIVVQTFAQSLSPGNEQRDYWGSEAADKDGSRNVIGIKNPAVDKLVDKIILAKDRADLIAATQALDRVLLWNHYVVPQWHTPFDRLAMWDRYGRPETLPARDSSFLRVWWWDEAAAQRLAKAR